MELTLLGKSKVWCLYPSKNAIQMSVQDAMGFSKAENSKSVRLLRAQLLGQLPIFLSENSIAWSIFLSIVLQSVELNVKFSAIVKKNTFFRKKKK